MSFLIDSHVLIWALVQPKELGKATRRIIDTHPDIYLSSVSVAELKMKEMSGKLSFDDSIFSGLAAEGIRELAFTNDHALEVGRFGSLVSHEPFDRLLLAQASSERMNFVTADQKILDLGLDFVVDARS